MAPDIYQAHKTRFKKVISPEPMPELDIKRAPCAMKLCYEVCKTSCPDVVCFVTCVMKDDWGSLNQIIIRGVKEDRSEDQTQSRAVSSHVSAILKTTDAVLK